MVLVLERENCFLLLLMVCTLFTAKFVSQSVLYSGTSLFIGPPSNVPDDRQTDGILGS